MVHGVIVVKHEELRDSELRVKKPVRLNAYSVVFNVFYEGRRLVVQTPPFVLSSALELEERGVQEYCCAKLCGSKQIHRDFYRRLDGVMSRVIDRASHAFPREFEGKNRVGSVCWEQDDPLGSVVRMRLKNVRGSVSVFDVERSPVAQENLLRNDLVTALFSVEYVWASQSSYGVECRLLQLRRFEDVRLPPPPPPPPLPSSRTVPGKPPPPPPPPPPRPPPPKPNFGGALPFPSGGLGDKYNRMIKAGVPMSAVQNCMKMDGYVDPKATTTPEEEKPKKGGGGGMFAALSQIASGMFSLKRAPGNGSGKSAGAGDEQETETSSAKSSKAGAARSGPPVPTLGEILGAKRRLRSIKDASGAHSGGQEEGDGGGSSKATTTKRFEPHNTFPFLNELRSGAWSLRPVNNKD